MLLVVLLTAGGCIKITSGPAPLATGHLGVYKSADSGLSWKSAVSLMNAEGKPLAISDVSVNRIVMDPNDNLTLYLASDKGMYYSFDGGESWQFAQLFGYVPINDVAVDYFNKCNVFVTAGQSIYKSSDCLRTFSEVYFDKTRPDLQITDIATEDYNKNVVYAANNKGEVLKSEDFGKTWQLKKSFNNPIIQILIDKDDTRIIYFLTESAGIFKTTDGTKTWLSDKQETDINNDLNQFPESRICRYLVQDMTQKDTFIYASRFGLLKTVNGGAKWESIELITPERGVNIYSLAIDPKDNKVIYYGTDSTLYKSVDNGKNWAPQKPPTIGMVNFLLIDSKDSKIIYIGGKGIKK